VLSAKGSAARNELVDDIVEGGEVRHVVSPGSIFAQSGNEKENFELREFCAVIEAGPQGLKPDFTGEHLCRS
jgi:hypothetical protein